MNELRCTYETPYGMIQVKGQRRNNEPSFAITVPDGIDWVRE